MQIIRYDGSFYGLIRSLAFCLRQRHLPDAIERENARQPSLISPDEEQNITRLDLAGDNIHDPAIFKIPGITNETWQNAWHAFLSEAGNIEMNIARYLLFALEKPGRVDFHITDTRVSNIHKLARRVLSERHRFMGLLRFRCIGENLYYAAIRPDNFILPILAPFFVERFADQRWIIHDRQRGLAAVYNLKTWAMIERDTADLPSDSPTEDAAQHLWQCFFDSIAVRERLNLALQQQCIPKKYWQDLIEKPGR